MTRRGLLSEGLARPEHGPARALGAWFGILALFVQLLVSVLPMPSAAATIGPDPTLTRICSTHHVDRLPGHAPQSPHGHAQCLVCVAVHLTADILPPPANVFIGRTRPVFRAALSGSFDGLIPSSHHHKQQPRGPPVTF